MSARVYLTVFGVLVLAAALGAQAVNLRPGKYEMTMEFSMPDQPSMKMPPVKTQPCITHEDVANLSTGKNLGVEGMGRDCKVTNFKVEADRATFTTTCSTGTWNAVMTFTGDGYTQEFTGKDNEKHSMMGKATAKRIGECTK
jgi:hypothetical protein